MDILIGFTGGLLAAFLGVIAGNGGLISMAVLLFLGLPLEVAVATNRFGAIGASTTAVAKYSKAKKVDWQLSFKLAIPGVFGALIGANLLITIDSDISEKIIGVVLILMIPVLLIFKNIGLAEKSTSAAQHTVGYVLYFLVGITGGIFGAGFGTVSIILIATFFGKKFINAVATNWVAWTCISIASLSIYIYNGLIDYEIAIPLLAGMSIGGWLGASTAIQLGDKYIRIFILLMQVVVVLKLLFF